MKLSVILCAYNPVLKTLNRVLDSLKNQTLPVEIWELVIVDNNSNNDFIKYLNIKEWQPNCKIVLESRQGLIYARIAGNETASTNYIVTVDDDTILKENYLSEALKIFEKFPSIGIFGGRSTAEFEVEPPDWVNDFSTILCIKDLGEDPIITQFNKEKKLGYPENGPFLILYNKCVFNKCFIAHFESNTISNKLGRKGKSLASGEDNDIVLTIYKNGYEVGYFPELKFVHIIPKERLTEGYIQKLVYSSNKTWVQVLALHGIFPWEKTSQYTTVLRKIKAFFKMNAWKNDLNYIKWKGACGIIDGRAEI